MGFFGIIVLISGIVMIAAAVGFVVWWVRN